MKNGGKVNATKKKDSEMKDKKMAKGGMAKLTKAEKPSKMSKVKTSPKPDGVAVKGKTKGTMVAMRKGGSCK